MWSLDPIDGTVNFVHGLPLCAVSLGLVHGRRPVLGVIQMPFLGGRYSAVVGQGAYLDGEPLSVTGTAKLSDAVVAIGDYAVGADSDSKNRLRLAVTAQLAGRALRVRMFGTSATDLAWLAAGKVDACIILSNNPWDTAAGVAIAREAGARIVDKDGSEHDFTSSATIAAGPALIADVLRLVQHAEDG